MADVTKVLRRLLDELDKEDKDALLEELKGRKITGAEIVAAIKELPPESRKEVREALSEVTEDLEDEEDDETAKKKTVKKNDDNDDESDDDESKKKTKARTRPGRKNGRAYGWWIDEKGEVVRLDIARVYTGEDEPDEVELLPKNDDDDEDDEAVA